MPRDKRPYITVAEGMPSHPKVEGLSDKAFRLLVETWCWCSYHKTDGRVKAVSWSKRGTATARRELVDAGLAEDDGYGGVYMHDYDEHQRLAAEIALASEARSEDGKFGAHVKNHVKKKYSDPDCKWCVANG